MKDFGHQMPDLCIVRLKGIQRGQVARSFFGSGRPRTPSLRRKAKSKPAARCHGVLLNSAAFGKNADANPAERARLLGVFG